ncbi:MAG: ATP-dependent DNA helicase [Clostridia bacterium]|nr:ATP-dependent DNA helicase [Clostridia bacterium]
MIFDAALKKVHISVGELCRTVVNHASIDVRGARIYPDNGKIAELFESKFGLSFTPDVSIQRVVSRGGIFYDISGICDGIVRRDGKTIVCVNRCINDFTSRITSDMAAETIGNAVALSYMVAESEMLSNISFLVTFYHNQNDVKYIEKTYTKQEMSAAFNRLLDMHRPFVALEAERVCVRLPEAKAASFPYREMRAQQRDFMIEVLRAVKTHGKAVIEAPTGTGKTMAALFPALKALGNGYVDKIFYFTSKTTTAFAAIEATKKLAENTGIRAVHVSAKERCCPIKMQDPFKCTPAKCPRANGHYKRTADAITDVVTQHKVIDISVINEFSNKHCVCPYELSLDLTEYCDIIICDYNYLIDEASHFRRYFSECADSGQKYLFLFDEAHNLIDRAKASFGAEIRLSKIRKFLDEVRSLPQNAVCEALSSIEFYVNSMRELCADSVEEREDGIERGFTTSHAFDKQFYDLLVAFTRAVDKYSRSPACGSLPDSIFDLNADAKKYISSLEIFDECFVHTVFVSGGEVVTKIVCLDPSKRLEERTKFGVASIFFSATLTPLEYYATLYGAADSVKLKLDSPYDRENLCVCIMDKLSVKYQFRSQNAGAVADAIMSVCSRRDGNYMVYFPSYEYMSEVQTLFKYKYPHIKTVMQAKGMSEQSRREFLDAFRIGNRSTLVGFCVLGGIYSEGIDLVGDRLIGTVIVGVGLTKPTDESEVVREYYDNKYEAGKEYAYTYPGFNRVLQAAGRVIRTETDRGVVVFIDERYAEPGYKELLPHQFRTAKFVGDTRSLEMIIDRFWNE